MSDVAELQDQGCAVEAATPEHRWLQRLVGEWTCENSFVTAPGEPPMTGRGTESVRSVGGLWVVDEGRTTMPDGTPGTTIITFGFDRRRRRFTGSFVGSMMTHLWLYDGALAADGRTLILDSEGPAITGDGLMAYRDIVELVDDDHRYLRSQIPDGKGGWTEFMTAHYRRVG
jgi:hypothetical protein